MSQKEGSLLDYLVASFIGLAFAMVVAAPAASAEGQWGEYIGILFVAGVFGFIPGGILACYINAKFHKMPENNRQMAGLGIGLFTAVVFAIINLSIAIVFAVGDTAGAAGIFIAWILSTVFAFIFLSLGGYVWAILEVKQLKFPEFFNLAKESNLPPPPPPVTQQVSEFERPQFLSKQRTPEHAEH